MPVSMGTTFWRCPECKAEAAFDGGELATVGTPYCGQCEGEDQEMEQLDDPIPTVLYLDDGEDETLSRGCPAATQDDRPSFRGQDRQTLEDVPRHPAAAQVAAVQRVAGRGTPHPFPQERLYRRGHRWRRGGVT